MDLGSLLNQSSQTLSTRELHELLNEADSGIKLDRISNATFSYPATIQESYVYFDVYIQLLLSIQYVDEAYGPQYTKSVITGSFRSCVDGLLHQHGLSWLLNFPNHFSQETWAMLHSTQDTTVLLLLYGVVLALGKQQVTIEWASALAAFLRCAIPIVTCHIWMTLWSLDETGNSNILKACFFREVNELLSPLNQPVLSRELQACLIETNRFLELQQAASLTSSVDQKIGNAILRSPFSEDELFLAYASLNTEASAIDFPEAYRFFRGLKKAKRLNKSNPLAESMFNSVIPKDPSKRIEMLSQCMQRWATLTQSLASVELEVHLKELVQERYPSENKTILDLILADWVARGKDGSPQHSIIIDALLLQRNFRYHIRNAPFYAINQEFRQPSTNDFGNTQPYKFNLILTEDPPWLNPLNPELLHGCLRLLKQLTGSNVANTENWIQDILKVTASQVIEEYFDWLSQEYNASQNPGYARHLLATMRNPRIRNWPALFYSYHIVPILLRNLDAAALASILEKPESRTINDFFSGCQQTEITSLVIELLQTKPKVYFDLLLSHLKNNMNSVDARSKQSRTWFQRHFIQPILLVAEENDTTAAAQLYHQLLTSPVDFDWFLATHLSEEPGDDPVFNLQSLLLGQKHLILPVRSIGLTSFLQQMIRMGDTNGRQRLVQYWNDAWTKPQDENTFAVPISWILQCIGLFKQSPYHVKNMIEHLVDLGLRRDTVDHSFLRNMVDLMMLSDVPHVDSVLNMFSKRYDAVSSDELDTWMAWYMTSVVTEVTEELYWQVKPIQDRKFAEAAVNEVLPRQTSAEGNPRRFWVPGKRWRGMRETERQRIRAIRRWMQRRPAENAAQTENHNLIRLVQRMLGFLSALVVPDNHPSLDIPAKRRLRDRLVLYMLFYLPLSKLKRLLKQDAATLEKLHAFVATCISIVQDLDASVVIQAQEILDSLYPTELGQEQKVLAS